MRFRPEPPFAHGDAPLHAGSGTAVLLCNLGTPDAPTPPALRRYLTEFLSDRRVVEIPRTVWWPILHGIILRVRPRKSAAKYASIWTADGSPLKVWTQRQAAQLSSLLERDGQRVAVRMAMRYGQPSIPSELDALKREGVTRVLVVPLYPQYSGTTTASVFDTVAAWSQRTRHIPEFRFVNRFHDDPPYIDALAERIKRHWQTHGRPDRLLMSFHGVPKRTLMLGDPYHCECHKTARLLAQRLGLAQDRYQVAFQSRFGKAEWLQPYTEPTLQAWGRSGVARVDVVCPGFVSDCLETLEEIAQQGRQAFLAAGGKEFHYIPCLNDEPAWMEALASLVRRHLGGWPAHQDADRAALEAQRQRALRLGAQR